MYLIMKLITYHVKSKQHFPNLFEAILLMAWLIIGAIVMNFITLKWGESEMKLLELMRYFIYAFFFTCILIYRRVIHHAYRLKWKPAHPVLLLLLIPLAYFFSTFFEPVALFIPSFSGILGGLQGEFAATPSMFILMVVMAPFFEEVIFRGVILSGFLKNYNPVKAILLSSLLFGLVHVGSTQLLLSFLFGIFLGILYTQTQSILACILLHMSNNFFVFIGHLSPHDEMIQLGNALSLNELQMLFVPLVLITLIALSYQIYLKKRERKFE